MPPVTIFLSRGAASWAAALCRERGYNDSLQYALDNLGWAALLQGDYGRARSHYEESLVVCKKLADRMIAAESLEGLACVAGAEGEAERAARLFGAAEALREPVREAVGYRHRPEEAAWREPYLGAARSILGETVWEEVLSRDGLWICRKPSITPSSRQMGPGRYPSQHPSIRPA